MSVDITKDKCALDLNLYYDDDTMKPANNMIVKEQSKIIKYIETVKLDVKNIRFSNSVTPILNNSGKGIVGYEIEISLSNDDNKEVFAVYKLKADGTRIYSVNKYDLK